MKKYLSILLSATILFAAMFPVNATEIKKNTNTSSVISLRAVDVSNTVLSVLSENGARINNDSIIEVLKVDNSEDTAICVTNFEGEEIVQDVFMSYIEDEVGNMVIDNSIAETLSSGNDHNMSGSYPPLSWDGSYIVHATATAARYEDTVNDPYGFMPFYKPYKCSFYYINYDNVNVSSIEVRYITTGTKYSYPGYEYMNGTYNHIVTAKKTNPAEGTTYTGYNYFPTNFVLACDDAEDMLLTFINIVNGSEDSYTVKLTNMF